MYMAPDSWKPIYNDLLARAKAGTIPMSRIDEAVARILRVKFRLGVFTAGKPSSRPLAGDWKVLGSPEHRAIGRQAVRESLVLLKNASHTLPLSKSLKHIVVAGQAADDLGMQCGGWTIDWQGRTGAVTSGGTTILAAIRLAVSPGTQVAFSADASETTNADAIILVIGELPYAEMKGDRKKLDLAPSDLALIKKARAAGVPVVTILFSGRPLDLNSALADSNAFIAAWLPGTEGQGVADLLFGNCKPTGKLPRNWLPDHPQYASTSVGVADPAFERGFGLNF